MDLKCARSGRSAGRGGRGGRGARRGDGRRARGFGAAGVGLLVILIALCIILYLYFGNGGSGKSYIQGVQATRKNAKDLKADIQTYGLTQLIVAYQTSNDKLPKTPEETGDEASFRDPWGNTMT